MVSSMAEIVTELQNTCGLIYPREGASLCCTFVDRLKKCLWSLYQEAKHVHLLEEEYNVKQDSFVEAIQAINTKMGYIWMMTSKPPLDERKRYIRKFALRIAKVWSDSDTNVSSILTNYKLVTASSNCPLVDVLEEIQGDANSTLDMFYTISTHYSCFIRGSYLFNKIIALTSRLEMSNKTYHLYWYMKRMISFLKELDTTISVFRRRCYHAMPAPQLVSFPKVPDIKIQQNETCLEDDPVGFKQLADLLKGELLGLEDCMPYSQALNDRGVADVIEVEIGPNPFPLWTQIAMDICNFRCEPNELIDLICKVDDLHEDLFDPQFISPLGFDPFLRQNMPFSFAVRCFPFPPFMMNPEGNCFLSLANDFVIQPARKLPPVEIKPRKPPSEMFFQYQIDFSNNATEVKPLFSKPTSSFMNVQPPPLLSKPLPQDETPRPKRKYKRRSSAYVQNVPTFELNDLQPIKLSQFNLNLAPLN